MKLKHQSEAGENLRTIYHNICKILNLSLDSTNIENIEKYSNFPSLDALGTALDTIGIRNMSVGIDSDQLLLVPTPSILHFNKDNGHFVILYETTDDNKFKIHDPSLGWYDLDADDLNKVWSGTALLIEESEPAPKYAISHRVKNSLSKNLMSITIVTLFVLLFLYTLFYNHNFNIVAINMLYLSGLLSSLYLVKVDMGDGGIYDVCKINSHFDCKSVLDSNGAKLFNVIKLSYLGVFYYLFLFLSWNFYLTNDSISHALKYFAVISYLSLAFIPFSISYQKFVVKRWCLFCLIVQGILLVSGILFYTLFDISYSAFFQQLPWNMSIWLFVAITLTYSVFLLYKSYSVNKKNKWRLDSLLFDTDLFKKSLLSNNVIDDLNLPKTVDYGDLNAAVTIIVVVDPFCESCNNASKQIDWMKRNTMDDFCVRTIFFTQHSKNPQQATLIASKILSLPTEMQNEALSGWFQSREVSEWLNVYEYGGLANISMLEDHNTWCDSQQIQHTPAIYFNGSRISRHYEVKDLHHHIITSNREIRYQNA